MSQRPPSPTKFSTQATDSPSKLAVPSRRQRNQPASRVDDIEFVTEISTSLLLQVRQLQGVLAERDEASKTLNLEKSQLELDVENLTDRLKTLDESEQRYKDENWSLETRTHELLAASSESASKAQRLQQALAVTTAERTAAQRELDDVKQAHGKLSDDYHSFRKAHDSEAGALRKTILGMEKERDMLHRKVIELTSQNQDLAKAVAEKVRAESTLAVAQAGSDPEDLLQDRSDTDHSPPPSPSKGAARNSVLESETLKSSLHHAHRMIQNLKSSIHREKSEKLELKRILQESRDELEARQAQSGAVGTAKRSRTKPQTDFPKRTLKLHQLGADRQTRIDMQIEDPEWEAHDGGASPTRASIIESLGNVPPQTEISDANQIATETEDAFETANEHETGTETEAFQTGNESLAGESSGDLTETESATIGNGKIRQRKNSPFAPIKRSSFISTASTSDDEQYREAKTPVQQPMKYRMRLGKGSRRSKIGSEEPSSSPATLKDSPASFVSNRGPKGQSLFAELGELERRQSDDDDIVADSRSQSCEDVVTGESATHSDSTVDSGMMTDPWIPSSATPNQTVSTDEQAFRHSGTLIMVPTESRTDDMQQVPVEASQSSYCHPSTTQHTYVKGQIGVVDGQSRLSFSPISILETIVPSGAPEIRETPLSRPLTAIHDEFKFTSSEQDKTESPIRVGGLGSVLGWAIGKKSHDPSDGVEDTASERRHGTVRIPETKRTFEEVSPNSMHEAPRSNDMSGKPTGLEKTDRASQTTLSSSHIDNLLLARNAAGYTVGHPSIANVGPKPEAISISPVSSQPSFVLSTAPNIGRESTLTARTVKRLGSVSSVRLSSSEIPPLPADHRQAIAAAQQAPPRDKNEVKTEGSMEPPIAPASAYRLTAKRPQTPNDPIPQTPTSATPRAKYSAARSSRSRRSSVSSFESELDARFNIRADGLPVPQGFDNNTDPRMIQAITQTMIGEYLWKYTRKAGRGEMSDKRHRRFFWVHPYTRTLYWSDQDPSTAGRIQLKAKSVAIEAVRVVVDDNPMPPGLHRKSLIVITPGRDIKFTASTGQRHETWFNALSYLLLRSGPDASDHNHITPEDVAEFNPGFVRPTGSRVSLSSYHSRTNTTRQSVISNRSASPTKNYARRIPPTPHATSSRFSQANHASIGSRISSYWRPTRTPTTNTMQGTTNSSTGSIYNANMVNDSAEDLRQVLEREEQESDKVENVRACCDGRPLRSAFFCYNNTDVFFIT